MKNREQLARRDSTRGYVTRKKVWVWEAANSLEVAASFRLARFSLASRFAVEKALRKKKSQ